MCMAMGATPQMMPTPVTPAPPAENTIAFDTKFNAEMKDKKNDMTITRDNPLLAKSQRARLDARTGYEAPKTGLQSA
jgi:hypothetical protein